MTENHPHSVIRSRGHAHDYLPAAGHDAFLPTYDLMTRLMGINRIHEQLVRHAELTGQLRILEIGCGTGNLTVRVKRAHPSVEIFGVDPDPLALARAQRKAGSLDIRFDRAYAQQLPYADGEFDRVLSSMMLHHLDDDAKPAAAAEVFRVLRPGGALYVVDIGGHLENDRGLAARLMRRSHHAAGNLGDAIPRLLSGAGFDCTEIASQRHRFLGRLTYYRATRPERSP
ncbi:MAG TPA: class I SAM-dependent methyltransferase [Mycobacterium sp.]|nr:class I SAM-dependent methyltransferase [Mycobacterium sp.]